jgi:glycerophosphoryl diester phosphodiesterase
MVEPVLNASSALQLIQAAWRDVRAYWRPLFFYNLIFQVVSVAVLGPVTACVTQWFLARSGDLAVSNTAIVAFLLSPVGLLWLVVAGTSALVLVYAASSGMLRIAWAHQAGIPLPAPAALAMTLKGMPALARLGVLHIRAHLIRLAPSAVLIGVIYLTLLSSYDIYYLVTQKPPVWWLALSLAAVVVCGIAWVNGRLYLRWILSLPAMLYEQTAPREALSRSAEIMKGQTWTVVRPIVAATVLLLAGPAVIAGLFEFAGGMVFPRLPENMVVLLPALVFFLGAYLIVGAIVGFATVALNAVLIARLYLAVREAAGLGGAPPAAGPIDGAAAIKLTRGTLALLGLALLFALGYAAHVVRQIDVDNEVAVTAHRGSSIRAPENSFAAIELAIEEGADFAELDFQELGDETIVMMHDTDFLRIARLDRKVWDVKYAEVKDLDVGSWFAPEYGDMRLKTLAEVLEFTRGRIALNIELKIHGREKAFIPNVVKTLRDADFAEHCIVTSLDLAALGAFRAAAPEFRVGAILAQTLGNPTRLDADVLAVSTGLATSDFIDAAHRVGKEVHVWTINAPVEMRRFIDRGVDSIMTDDPLLLRRTLAERAELSHETKLLLTVRALWLK